jgi:hypothetical protein
MIEFVKKGKRRLPSSILISATFSSTYPHMLKRQSERQGWERKGLGFVLVCDWNCIYEVLFVAETDQERNCV